ncbi:hypothetical protein BST81_13730 [Leptolyngbya sp. 'hensonii']|nr:hypothetical protein BST81_13730 [Leptolyngbya sp. 'hensonii']
MLVDINSTEESAIPDLDITASRTDRLIAVRDAEWKGPRKELQLLMRNSRIDWQPIASISLLNRLPYYHIPLMPYFTDDGFFNVSNDCSIGARIVNVGHNFLEGDDRVTIFGSVKEEAFSLPTDAEEITGSEAHNWVLSTGSQVILPANPNRLQVTLINTSRNYDAYLAYGGVAERGKGITLVRGGGTYEINLTNLYRGSIAAVADGPATLTGLEGF